MLSNTRAILLSSLFITYLVSSQSALAESQKNMYSCFDPASGERFLTNVKSEIPTNCQDINVTPIPEFKQSNQDNGLRPEEKAQLQEMNTQEEKLNQVALYRAQHVDEHVGLGIYGSWLDKRHDQCFAYKARVEEARAGRKDDVGLNRQIQRDLEQIKYYCP